MAKRKIKVVGIPRQEPDVQLYVQALIELARQLQAEEEAARPQKSDAKERVDD